MSGNPRPTGRDFNPKGQLVGTQTFRLINGVFAAAVVGSAAAGYWLYHSGFANKLLNWIDIYSPLNSISRNSELQDTQRRIKRLRVAQQFADDPVYRSGEERVKLGLATGQQATTPADTAPPASTPKIKEAEE